MENYELRNESINQQPKPEEIKGSRVSMNEPIVHPDGRLITRTEQDQSPTTTHLTIPDGVERIALGGIWRTR